jgi:hypothetical protein
MTKLEQITLISILVGGILTIILLITDWLIFNFNVSIYFGKYSVIHNIFGITALILIGLSGVFWLIKYISTVMHKDTELTK